MKRSILIIASILILISTGSVFWIIRDKGTIDTSLSFEVCQAPGQCKTIYGATTADLQNIIGRPQEMHRNASTKHVDTEQDFLNGYFDEQTFYFRHDNHVFYFINAKIRSGFFEDAGLIEGADAESFELIDANFAKDKKHVYGRVDMDTSIAFKIIEGADPESFEPLDFPFAKDKNAVYNLNHRVENVR